MLNPRILTPTAIGLIALLVAGAIGQVWALWAAGVILTACTGVIGWALIESRRDPYDLQSLHEIDERAEWEKAEADFPTEFDGVVCPQCGTNYSPRLPTCPRCAKR